MYVTTFSSKTIGFHLNILHISGFKVLMY